MVALSAQYIALITYAAAYTSLVIFIGVYVYFARKRNPQTTPEEKSRTYFEQVWYAREIYTAVVVHLYDQATDIAVMVQWGQLTKKEVIDGVNLESVNMLTFFIPGLAFIIIYRVITMVFAIYEDTKTNTQSRNVYQDMDKENETQRTKRSCSIILWDLILSIFDLYFVKVVYKEFEAGEYKPNKTHRSLQLCESLFESMPQVVLQSVFLLRYTATNTGGGDDTIGITLIIISITASILSIANKYAWFDQQAVVLDAKELNVEKKKCYISWRFLIRAIWRWSDLCVRFVIFSLLWVCIGGLYILIYVGLSYLFYYFIVLNRIKMKESNGWYRLLATTICIVGIILDYEWHFCILRLIDNGLLMLIISIFVFINFDCADVACSDNSKRDALNTPIIFTFILMGLIAYFIELIIYPILQSQRVHIIKKALQGREFFSIILFGDSAEIPCYYLTYYVDTQNNENNKGLGYQDIIYFTGKKSNEDCEKLGEMLENIFKDNAILNLSSGDIAIDYKQVKVFKYGISIKCLQNVYTKSNQQRFGDEAMNFIKKLYNNCEILNKIENIFEEHFCGRDCDKNWKLTFDTRETTFIVLNIDENDALNENNEGECADIIEKYRFGQELKKYNRDIRIISGHDYTNGLHNQEKQVIIKVIDRWSAGNNNNNILKDEKNYSKKNIDIFIREKISLKILNKSNNNINILPYIGWDDAHDAYFIVTKKLFGPHIIDKITTNNITIKQMIGYIKQMFEILSYVHSNNIVMRNISTDSFQFNDNKMYLTHYEQSRIINDNKMYGNIQTKVVYLSPELCKIVLERYKNRKWTADISGKMYKTSDVWALGILTFYLICGCHPFYKPRASANKLKKTLHKIINHNGFNFKQENIEPFKYEIGNKVFETFMNKILCNDYNKRLNICECLNDEFFSNSFLNKLSDNEIIKPEIIDVLKGNNIQNKLHVAIGRVRAYQIEENEKKLQLNNEISSHHKTELEINNILQTEAEQGIREQFKRIDLDGDGYTTVEELTQLLISLGYAINYAQKEAHTIMKTLDLDGDGSIDFNEFAQAWVKRKLSINDKYAHAIFNVFDQNGDGFISIHELKHALFPTKVALIEDEKENINENDNENDFLDGFVNAIEEDQTNEEVKKMLTDVDENHDGKISFEEFHKAMTKDFENNQTNNDNGIDCVPFRNIFEDISFKEINKNGNDVLFENEKDYIDDEEEYLNEKNNITNTIPMEIQNQMDGYNPQTTTQPLTIDD